MFNKPVSIIKLYRKFDIIDMTYNFTLNFFRWNYPISIIVLTEEIKKFI